MLKPLKKKSKKWLILKLKFKSFIIHQSWVYLIVFSSIALCAWLFNKPLEGIMFCIAHTCIRNTFDLQFHFNRIDYCLALTLAIIWFAIPITLPLTVSLLSSIPIAFAISYIGYIAQDRINNYKEVAYLQAQMNSLVSELQLYKHIDIYNMPETELRQYAASQQLSEAQIDILCMVVYQHLRICEICKYAAYGRTTVKYHINQIKKKLNLITFP